VMAEARALVGGVANVVLHDIPTNDAWCRDHGPTFLVAPPGAPAALVDWEYNAWGGKYPPFDKDNATAGRIAQLLGVRSIRPHLILEGGAIEGDGQGTIMTTESCLLNPNRNPGMNREIMTEVLQVWLQAERIIWLPGGGVEGDDTDGHIDQSARFVDPERVLVAAPYAADAPEAPELRQNMEAVAGAIGSTGRHLQPIPLPMPAPKFQDGSRLPACYCNYVLVNGGVVVPTFRDAADDRALQILQDCYPDRRVIGVDCLDLVWGLGAFHCMTQQQPANLS